MALDSGVSVVHLGFYISYYAASEKVCTIQECRLEMHHTVYEFADSYLSGYLV